MFRQNIVVTRILRLRKVFACFRLLVTSSFRPQNLTDKNIRSMNDICEKNVRIPPVECFDDPTRMRICFKKGDDVVVKCMKVEVAINRGP